MRGAYIFLAQDGVDGLMAPVDRWGRAESKEGPGWALVGSSENPRATGRQRDLLVRVL